MDILKSFSENNNYRHVKEDFIELSKKQTFIVAKAYLTALCIKSPKYCIQYKKIFFTVYKDIETKEALLIGTEIYELLDDDKFTTVLAARYKRVGDMEKYTEIISKIKDSKEKKSKIERNKIAKFLDSCTSQESVENQLIEILNCKLEEQIARYKIIFSTLKDNYTLLATKYGMLYFNHNPLDIKFSNILLKRLKKLNQHDDILHIESFNKNINYLNKLKKGKLFKDATLDINKFTKELKVVSHKLPSFFVSKYIEFIFEKYPDYKIQLSKKIMEILKNTHTQIALKHGKTYSNENENDLKFRNVLTSREKKYNQKIKEDEYINKLKQHRIFLAKNLNMKNYSEKISIIAKNFSYKTLVEVIEIFLNKFTSQKNRIQFTTFSALKDTHPNIAIKYGINYIEDNLEDVKFAKVLLRRINIKGDKKTTISLAKKIFDKTQDEHMHNILGLNDITLLLETSEELYLNNRKNQIGRQLHKVKRKYPELEALLYRKFIRFYTKKEYKKAEMYALKSLKIKYSEYVVKELYDLHMSHGHIKQALSVLPKNPELELLNIKKENASSLLHLFKYGFDVPIKKVHNYKPTKKKVFYLLHNRLPYNSGGYATRSHGLLTGVSSFGWEMHGVSRLGYPWDKMPDMESRTSDTIESIKYHRLLNGEIGLGKLPLKSYLEEYASSLLELAKKEKPQMIHAASNYMNGIVANYVAKCLGIPSIYEVRGLWEITRISREPTWKDSQYYELMSKMEAEAAKGADIVFTLTEALRDEMVKRGVERNKIQLLPNGVISNRFSPLKRNKELEKRLNIKNKTVVGFIGSFAQYEGLDYIVEAMEILVRSGRKNIIALMVGDGAVSSLIQDMVSQKGLDEYFIFTGRIPHDEVEEYYSLVDIAPLPRKGLPVCEMVSPLKPFEAMAMEIPVLSSNVSALAEIVQDGYNGMLFEKDNVKDLAKKIEILADDPALRKKLGKQSRKWVLKERDWGVISERLHNGYSSLRKQ